MPRLDIPAIEPFPSNRPKVKKYVLVLDLDETLVHFKESRYLSDDEKLKVRPHVTEFLELLAPHYEFVVFTAASRLYADFAVKKLDPAERFLKQKLYRDSCKPMGRHMVKDLEIVVNMVNWERKFDNKERVDISKLIIIDNITESFQL